MTPNKPNNKVEDQGYNCQSNIALAEAQLLGFTQGKWNRTDIEGLVISMGLTEKEWKQLKKEYGLNYMDDEDIEDIDNYFKSQNN